jgi:hypothetical protein
MMVHLDIEVEDLEAAIAHPVAAVATLAEYQPQESVRVHLDPASHPFCLWVPDKVKMRAGRGRTDLVTHRAGTASSNSASDCPQAF